MSISEEILSAARRDGADRDILQFDNLITAMQYEVTYAVTERWIDRKSKVLDWGCGNGHFSYFLTKRGIPTSGYSFEEVPAFLRTNDLFSHFRGSPKDPVRLPFPDQEFDAVFSIGVLEHVYETGGSEVASLKEIGRLLRPKGLFLCFHFPNKYQWSEAVGKALGATEYYHRKKYSIGQIRSLLHETGFQLSEWGRYNFLPRNQIRKLPPSFKESRPIATLYQAADRIFAALFPMLCTNFYFVAEKRGDGKKEGESAGGA
ncbi:MAG TPA: class I SAM-dependent methyltransferase [Bacteroidota bacterium]|nr:class I SAM-dependent methyltransferase [Bacteroidota bacterium]